MNILVTGGCGFIGSNIIEYHLAKGDHVYAMDDCSTGSQQNIASFVDNPLFKFEQADILTWPNLDKAVEWADRVYHMAAVVGVYHVLSEPLKVLTSNITGTEHVLEAIAKSKKRPRVLIASSSSVYGHSDKHALNENDALIIEILNHPLRNYAISKIADEAVGLAYYQTSKLPITIIRLFNTTGPRQTGYYGMVVPRFVKQAFLGEPITIYGDGTQTRSFCDVRDVVEALNLIAEKPESYGEIINVGRDSEISMNDLAKLILEQAKSKSVIKYVPYQDAYGEKFTDIKRRRPDLTKLYKLTGFKHKWTLEQTIEDLLKRQKIATLTPANTSRDK